MFGGGVSHLDATLHFSKLVSGSMAISIFSILG
jgi:hypothetical protein